MSGQSRPSMAHLDSQTPWPGLWPYDEQAKAFFFGRQSEADALFRLIRRETLAVFYGQSGLGKTSLLQAGLFPKLRETGLLPVMLRVDYGPEALSPVAQTKRAIADILRAETIDARPPSDDETLWEYFHAVDVDFWDSQNRPLALVMVFDQFEERFTRGRQSAETDSQADAWLAEIAQLVENRRPPAVRARLEREPGTAVSFDFEKRSCKVVLSLREDFLPELEGLRGSLPSVLENSYRLQAMAEAQAMAVVLNPSRELVSGPVAVDIVRFVAGGEHRRGTRCTVEPVLLSAVLFELNQRRLANRQSQITCDILSLSRENILEDFCENALAGLPYQARLLVEEGLLTGSGRRDSVAWEDAMQDYGVDDATVFTLIGRHLLRREDRPEGARLELVHDRLADVVRRRREVRREQERCAKELEVAGLRDQELLREQDAQRRRVRRLRWICLVCASFAVIMAALSLYAVRQSARAKKALVEATEERQRAESARDEANGERRRADEETAKAEAARNQADIERQNANASSFDAELQKNAAYDALRNLRESEAEAQRQKANAVVASNDANLARARAEEAEATARKQQGQAENMMSFMLHDLSDALRPIGRLDLMSNVAVQALDYYDKLGTDIGIQMDDKAHIWSQRFTAYINLAHALALQGKSTNALATLQSAKEIAYTLSAAGAGTSDWASNLCLCRQKIGDLLRSRGESLKARDEFNSSLEIAARYAKEQPTSSLWQKHLMVIYGRLSEVDWALGNKSLARSQGLLAVKVAEKMAQVEPDNPEWEHALSVSYTQGACMSLAEWETELADNWSNNGLRIATSLVSSKAEWKADLATSYDTRGDVLLDQEQPHGAKSLYLQAMQIRAELTRDYPGNLDYERDWLGTYFRVARVLMSLKEQAQLLTLATNGWSPTYRAHVSPTTPTKRFRLHRDRTSEVIRAFEAAVSRATQLSERDPGNADWQHELARGRALLGDMFLKADKSELALAEYDRVFGIREQLSALIPASTGPRYWLALAHVNRAATLRRLDRHEEAADATRRALDLFWAMASRWPNNATISEGPRVGKKDLTLKFPIGQLQLRDAIAAFRRGFARAEQLADKDLARPDDLADFARYSAEKAVSHLFRAEVDEALNECAGAAFTWRRLLNVAPNSPSYQTNWTQTLIALCALQLFSGQAQSAIVTARQGLAFKPDSQEFQGLLTIGYVVDNQYESACALLRTNKALMVSPTESFPKAVLDDLHRLRDKGLLVPDLEELDKWLATESVAPAD